MGVSFEGSIERSMRFLAAIEVWDELYLRLIQKTRILSDTVLYLISFDPWLRYFMLSRDIWKIRFDFYQFDPKE